MNVLKEPRFAQWLEDIKFFYQPYLVAREKKNLPDFLIFGAQKCGTTALWYNLNLHPEVYLPKKYGRTEVQFFSKKKHWYRGVRWYMGHFPYPEYLQGEKAPEYLFRTDRHHHIYRLLPDVKLIILMRNPVDRAYSQWNHYNQIYENKSKHWGWRKTDFETALKRFDDLTVRGEYIDQIENILNYYSPTKIYIGIAERLKRNPDQEMEKIFSFLGISQVPIQYKNKHLRKYPHPMKEKTRARLNEHFRSYNERLFTFLGERISEWEG